MRENKDPSKAKSIAPKRAAKDAQLSDAYVFYDLLSTDAHPTARALNRYVIKNDREEITGIDLDPEAAEEELADTVSLGCYGLIIVLTCGCKILNSAGKLGRRSGERPPNVARAVAHPPRRRRSATRRRQRPRPSVSWRSR
jgi:hypothetical protein